MKWEGTVLKTFSCAKYSDLSCGDKELLPGFHQGLEATISPALEKDREDCFCFVLIPNEPPRNVVAHSIPIFIACTIQWSDFVEDVAGAAFFCSPACEASARVLQITESVWPDFTGAEIWGFPSVPLALL